ncbi:Mitochondrial inner membrane translocase complex [Perilla frutescens var. hirtella]|uniref:Large ribosomal subunit protein mL45 n=1 Tax=Perilla frutescens var. hirtella TaxID=608512 RepID=A0AAD4IRA9_PERFH|nr:Mitochondrial inner membrane translocase complex [Perilla frutescens var. hirtella]
MARALTQSCRRILPYQTPSRWWLEQPLEHSYLLLKTLPDVKSPGIVRFISAQATAPPQARPSAAVKVSLTSPGFVGDPYSPSQPISFWHRCFTRSGWKRTKEEFIAELKSAYAIAKVRRKYGYSKQKFYEETTHLYQEINTLMANGDKRSLRKFVTENMYSALKNEIKHRETVWAHVHWELIMPIVKIRTLRARLIGTDKNDIMRSFIQITLEFLSKQKFEAYDSNGAVVAGDKDKEVLVRDIWVFERSLFHHGSYWRLCGRIKV